MKAIAIDGPSGAGKSTIARMLAQKLSFVYVDTGALYRTIGYYMHKHGIDTRDAAEVAGHLKELSLELVYQNGVQKVMLNGEDVSNEIRTPQMAMCASEVSAIPRVREYLLSLQREIAAAQNVVMDGRDIGTVVLPDADIKIYLTATPEDRANRRYHEHLFRGEQVEFEKLLADILKRDEQDMNRKISPLKKAEDAILIDTSNKKLPESFALIFSTVTKRLSESAKSKDE